MNFDVKRPIVGTNDMTNARKPPWKKGREGRAWNRPELHACTCTLHVYALVRALCSYTWVINFTSLSRSINCIHKVNQFCSFLGCSLGKKTQRKEACLVFTVNFLLALLKLPIQTVTNILNICWTSIYWKILGAAVLKTAVSSEITPGFLSEVIIYSAYPLLIPT